MEDLSLGLSNKTGTLKKKKASSMTRARAGVWRGGGSGVSSHLQRGALHRLPQQWEPHACPGLVLLTCTSQGSWGQHPGVSRPASYTLQLLSAPSEALTQTVPWEPWGCPYSLGNRS